jgi:cbb3-type cytochrome oxidase subunit 3
MIEQLSAHLSLLQFAHLLWGVALFVGLALWIYWPSRRDQMRDHGAMILTDEPSPTLSVPAARGHHVEH